MARPESQAALRAREALVPLAEAIERIRQEVGVEPGAGVGDRDSRTPIAPRRALTAMRPPAGVNLTAFDSRFQRICCSRAPSPWIAASPRSTSIADA